MIQLPRDTALCPIAPSNYPPLEEELLSVCQTSLLANSLLGAVNNIPIKQVKIVLLAFSTVVLGFS